MSQLQIRKLEEFYESSTFEKSVTVPEDKLQFPLNCLVVYIHRRHAAFARDLILASEFKNNFLRDKKGKPVIVGLGSVTMSFIGIKEITDRILQMLKRHGVHPRVLRNSPFRRHFLKYSDGKFYAVSKQTLR